LSLTAVGQTSYETYVNARFGYEIAYPTGVLRPQKEAENGDGRVFLSKNGTAELRVWGQYNALTKTLKEKYQEDLDEYGSGVTYKSIKSRSYVISGIKGGKIFYKKTILKGDGGDSGDTYYMFTMTYQKSDKVKYDPIVERIAGSFRHD
jgi:hypothetical protein